MTAETPPAASPSLASVAALVGFLRSRRGDPGPGDLTAAGLVDAPEALAASVASTSGARRSDDPVVLGSIWWQGYAYRTAGTTLAAWLVAGAAPDPSAAAGSGVGTTDGRPSSLLVGPDASEVHDLADLIGRLFADHLDPVAEALRSTHRIGARLVWGNVAASVASCLGAVINAPGADQATLAPRAERVTCALPHGIAGLGVWLEPYHRYRRRTCCLWWKTPAADGATCEDCSLRTDDPEPTERTA